MDNLIRDELRYYSEQSIITDPREYVELYDKLPDDVEGLTKVVNGIIIHGAENEIYDVVFSKSQIKEELLRTVPQMLAQIKKTDPRQLIYRREPSKRLVGMCRDMSVLLVSLMRHKNIPARVRAGFANYFNSDIEYEDHWIVEYWDKESSRWRLVDPQLDEVHKRELTINFDSFDLKPGDGFMTAGQVLKECNAGKKKPDDFGYNKWWKGLKSIRGNLLQDFNCLNRLELMPWDLWTTLIKRKKTELTKEDLALFDLLAEITTNVDSNFGVLNDIYENCPYDYKNEIEFNLRYLNILGDMKTVDPNKLHSQKDILQKYKKLEVSVVNNKQHIDIEAVQNKFIPDKPGFIVINGARQNNLKNIKLEIPKNKFVVITGVSGSGKSSLAFDVIYAEGKRRYMEGFSSYLRNQMGVLDKPEVDRITGLNPPIAIEQKTVVKNPRSTVGTLTDLIDCFRVLYSKVGTFHCPQCGKKVKPTNSTQILKTLLSLKAGIKINILIPVVKNKKGTYSDIVKKGIEEGFKRIRIDGKIRELRSGINESSVTGENIEFVGEDIFIPDQSDDNHSSNNSNLHRYIEKMLKLGKETIRVLIEDNDEVIFSNKNICDDCNLIFPKNTTRMFDYNSHEGACHECNGLGVCLEVDESLIIKDPSISVLDGASNWWGVLRNKKRTGNWMIGELYALADKFGVDLDKPWCELSDDFKHAAMHGTGDIEYTFEYISNGRMTQIKRPAYGAITNINRLFRETKSESSKNSYVQFMKEEKCPICEGEKLSMISRYVLLWNKRIPEVTNMPIDELKEWVDLLVENLEPVQIEIADEIIAEIQKRLNFMIDVGLHYLTLDRPAPTLSGGEGQRIRLATQLGSSLVGLLYVLDEPSIGLHPKDQEALLKTIIKLKDDGNSVIVVEHDADTMMAADWIIDIGPGAGSLGGNIVAMGTPTEIKDNPDSVTGKYLSGELRVSPLNKERRKVDQWLEIKGARLNNLRNVDVKIPLGVFTCVTGVSGSGKSSLIIKTLAPALENILMDSSVVNKGYDSILGHEKLDKIIQINQDPIGRSPRSTPATYIGVFDEIRKFYTNLPISKARNYKTNQFSFNSKTGQCVNCDGYGNIKVEMHFMPDTWVTCTECEGKRFNPETLEVIYKGKSIADVLDMDILTALEFFEDVPSIRGMLQTLNDVGLYYLKLGQNSTTLSGGEAQRIKLAKELQKTYTGNTIYILDEPTTGLHFSDITKLLVVLQKLCDAGNTVILIEHNTEVISASDWIIDMGPGGGIDGGEVIAEGTPEEVAHNESSYTGKFLKTYLRL